MTFIKAGLHAMPQTRITSTPDAQQGPFVHYIEIDHAVTQKEYSHAQTLITRAQSQHHETLPNWHHAKLAAVELSLPYRAATDSLTETGTLPENFQTLSNTTFLRATEVMRTALEARTALTFNCVEQYTERELLTGIVSEIALFALLVREGVDSPFIPTFATRAEDRSIYVGKKRRRTGFDLRVTSIDDPRYQALVQAKTAHFKEEHGRYITAITPISIEEISANNYKGGRSLQWAIADDGTGDADARQRQLIIRSGQRLRQKIIDGLHRRPEA